MPFGEHCVASCYEVIEPKALSLWAMPQQTVAMLTTQVLVGGELLAEGV